MGGEMSKGRGLTERSQDDGAGRHSEEVLLLGAAPRQRTHKAEALS